MAHTTLTSHINPVTALDRNVIREVGLQYDRFSPMLKLAENVRQHTLTLYRIAQEIRKDVKAGRLAFRQIGR